MKKPVPQGSLAADFPAPAFDSSWRALGRSAVIFFRQLPFLAGITVLVYLPGALAVQAIESLLDIPVNGLMAYLLSDAVDLIFGSLALPAVVYGLVMALRTG